MESDLPVGVQLERTILGQNEAATLAWSPDGAKLAVAYRDKTIRIWNAQTWTIRKQLQGHSDAVTLLAWSPDSRNLASGSVDFTVRVWSASDGRLRQTLKRLPRAPIRLAWRPVAPYHLLTIECIGLLLLWDVQKGPTADQVRNFAFQRSALWSPDGAELWFENNERLRFEEISTAPWSSQENKPASSYRKYRKSL